MMIKYLAFILVFFFHTISHACTVPSMGPEYDNLIKVEKISHNKFKATISKKAINLDYGAEIKINYYPENTNHKVGDYWKEIHSKSEGENYVATFDLKKIEDHIPFVFVYWFPKQPGLCGAFGKSQDIILD